MALDIRHEDYTFIDIGCGKGRVLLIASELPFRRIIGVEFAPSLAEIARQNLRHYRGLQRCKDIEVITGDATEYEFPSGPQVLYFYSPFSPAVLDQVVRRVEDSFQRSPRDLLVMFSGVLPMRDRGFGSRPECKLLHIDAPCNREHTCIPVSTFP
jgi:SAM-dependent methyltransferase